MWVVDTCIAIDVADEDPTFGVGSANCLAAHLERGLVISPVSYVELAPVFAGSQRELDRFLAMAGILVGDFTADDVRAAFVAWNRHISGRRAGRAARRPVADALIGALALRHEGLITRNGGDFASFYPRITIVDPTTPASPSAGT